MLHFCIVSVACHDWPCKAEGNGGKDFTEPTKDNRMGGRIKKSQRFEHFFEIAFLDFIEYSKKTNFSEFCVFFVFGKHKCQLYGNMGSVRIKRWDD